VGVLVRGALLAEVAGGLLAERSVLGSQAGDLCACGVQAGAERLGGGPLGGRAWSLTVLARHVCG
jgi:hypothetical protein